MEILGGIQVYEEAYSNDWKHSEERNKTGPGIS